MLQPSGTQSTSDGYHDVPDNVTSSWRAHHLPSSLCYLFYLSFVFYTWMSCFRVCSLLPCGHLLGNGWSFGSCLWCLCFRYFPMWYLGSGATLDCIVSWSLPSFLLITISSIRGHELKPTCTLFLLPELRSTKDHSSLAQSDFGTS